MAVIYPDPAWRPVVYGYDGIRRGTVQHFTSLTGRLPLNGVGTLSLTVPHHEPLFTTLRDDDCTIQLRRVHGAGSITPDEDILFHGAASVLEEVGDESGVSLAINCADPIYRLKQARLYETLYQSFHGTTHTRNGWARIATNCLNYGLAEGVADPGAGNHIDLAAPTTFASFPGGVSALSTNEITLTPTDFNSAWDLWTTALGGVGGYDWRFEPYDEPTPGVHTGVYRYGTREVRANLLGEAAAYPALTAENTVTAFRYGGAQRNVDRWKRIKSYDTLANHTWTLRPDNTLMTSTNAPLHGGSYAAAVQASDIANDATMQKLLDEHVELRQHPRQVYELTPRPNGPRYKRDYELGDQVAFSARIEDTVLFSGTVRVHGVELEVGDDGSAVERPITVYEPES